MTEIANLISQVGFPIACCVGLAWFCKLMLDKSEAQTSRMFDMYEKSNSENRQAIEANTRVIERLCDRLDKDGD